MRRRRRTRAPHFRVPTPRNAITGLPKELRRPRSVPYTMVFRVQSISDDYLVCEGWSPVSHTWLSNIIVAVPYTLRVNPNGSIRYPAYTDSYTKVSVGSRSVLRVGETVPWVETIEPAYFVGDLIVAVRMEGIIGEEVLKPVLVGSLSWSQPLEVGLPSDMPMDGMTQDDKPVFWMDINVAGRRWLPQQSPTSPPGLRVYSGFVRFELKTAITPGSSATAYLLDKDGNEDTGTEFTVYDSVLGDIRAPITAKGWAKYMPDSEHWEIVNCQRQATKCKGKVKGTTTAPTDFIVDNVVAYNGLSPVANAATELGVKNTFADDADNVAIITFSWNETDDQWETDDIACTTS